MIRGTVQSVLFQNPENGYCVLKVRTEQGEAVTVVGVIPMCVVGERLAIIGRWTRHQSFGQQFEAEFLERLMPETTSEILAFLSSRAVKGIGPKMAEKIVSRFGEKSLNVLEQDPMQLTQIPGISEKKAQEMSESFQKQSGIRRLIEFLTIYHLPAQLAVRLYRAYGELAQEALRDDPYLLTDSYYRADFSQVDAFAIALGVSADDERRVEAGILFELSYNLGAGHTFIPQDKLRTATCALLDLDGEMIDAVSDEELQAYCGELTSRYKMMDDVARDKFEASVRASIGLQKMAERSDIDVMVFNDIDRAMFELVGLRAGFYHPWFNDNCSVLVPEADIGAGLITYLLKLISGKNVNFLEPFHIESDYGTFAGGHAGPNDHNDPAWQQNVVIARDVRFAKTSYKYAGAPFAWYRISPGRKTMAQLVECDGRYKLVATLVDSLEGDHILATYSHSIFRPVVPVERLFEEILKIGTTQHFAIVDGDYLRELGMLAEIMDFEYHEIMN